MANTTVPEPEPAAVIADSSAGANRGAAIMLKSASPEAAELSTGVRSVGVPSAVPGAGHCVPLDGVRGIAVLLVLCYDCLKLAPSSNPLTFASRWIASAGWTGVDLFFVLSGYLITGVLLETRGRPGYWRSFFLRRSLRIFPLYYATLFAIFCMIPFVLWLFSAPASAMAPFAEVRGDQAWYWLYLENWLFAWRRAWPTAIPIKHFWSLAIEEQFYLIWPLVVALCSRRLLIWVCLSLSICSLALRVCLLTQGVTPMAVFVMTVTRLDGLCMGALLAVLLRNARWRSVYSAWFLPAAVCAFAGMAVLNLVWPVLRSETIAAYSAGHFLLALTYALLIAAAQCAPRGSLLTRLLSLRVLVIFGLYSYAIYVFHKFVYLGLQQLNWEPVPESVRGWLVFAATVAGSLAAAFVSGAILERPCLALKKYFPRPDEVDPANIRSRHAVQKRSPASVSVPRVQNVPG